MSWSHFRYNLCVKNVSNEEIWASSFAPSQHYLILELEARTHIGAAILVVCTHF